MAEQTSTKLRNLVIYEIYIRNHTVEGTFSSIISDLDRIKNLGVDIIWFMPIHPIGKISRKGSLGCPYSIEDYDSVNPEYGTEYEFEKLLKEIHKRGMKCIIDVVYNHTSHESKLYKLHPDAFYSEDKIPKSKVSDWSDVIDIDYEKAILDENLICSLEKWIDLGVDGFRCDVASMVPVDFWLKARSRIEDKKKDVIWLAESVEPHFVKELRDMGHKAWSESEVFEAFDILYDYDVHEYLKNYFAGNGSLKRYIEGIKAQDGSYQENYVKLKFLENHDNPRASYMINDKSRLWNWTAFMYFQKGAVLLYAGQESYDKKTPSLFEKDEVNWENRDIEYEKFIKKLGKIKKELPVNGKYSIEYDEKLGVVISKWENSEFEWIGIFDLENKSIEKNIPIKYSYYKDLMTGSKCKFENRYIRVDGKPFVLRMRKDEI
jgi:glycosidase